MKKLFFFLFCYSIFALSQASIVVRQCTCDELSDCKNQAIASLSNCVNKCKTSSTSNILTQTLQCFNASAATGDCITKTISNFCTFNLNQTIDSSTALEIPGTGVVRKVLHQKIYNRVNQPNTNALNILTGALASNETEVKNCLNECVGKAEVIPCLKAKSCSLKKPETSTIFSLLPLCRNFTQQFNNNLCQCLKGFSYDDTIVVNNKTASPNVCK